MSTLRLRRLQADFQNLSEVLGKQPKIRLIEARGNPPEQYKLEYHVRSLKKSDDAILPAEQHLVEISLPRDYPKTPPHCRMLSPVFHPNIAPHAICVGDHWSVGEPLWSIVLRIGEMLAYQAYNTKSPLNGEAARWADENRDRLPLDPIALLVAEPIAAAGDSRTVVSAVVRSATPPEQRPFSPDMRRADWHVTCPACQARYRVPAKYAGREFACTKCHGMVPVPADPPSAQPAMPPSHGQTASADGNTSRSNGAMHARCPNCAAQFPIPAASTGQAIVCPQCSHGFAVSSSQGSL